MVSGALIPRTPNPVIAALGDSRTAGKVNDAITTYYPYTNVLSNRFQNSVFLNFGDSGVLAKDYIAALTAPNTPYPTDLLQYTDVALLMIGVNDLSAYINPPATTKQIQDALANKAQIAQVVWSNIWVIMKFCWKKNPNMKIVLMTLPDVGKWWNDLQTLQDTLNGYIRAYGKMANKDPRITVLDFAPDTTLYSQHSTTAHYWPAGYTEMAVQIGNALHDLKLAY